MTSAGLIGRTMPDGTTLTEDNLDAWIRPQLPTQGVPQDAHDASVWNYAVDRFPIPGARVPRGARGHDGVDRRQL